MDKNDAHSAIIITVCRPRSLRIQDTQSENKSNKKAISDRKVRKPSEASLRKYSLHDDTELHVHNSKKDHLILSYKSYTKEQNTLRKRQRSRIKLQETYKIINTDLRNRIHVDHPVDNVQAVTDIDNTFFQCCNHSLAQYVPLYKSLKFLFHKQLTMKQEVGYRNDCIFNIDVNQRREEKAYERNVQRYLEQLKLFDIFVSQDYNKSMAFLNKAEVLATKVNEKSSELQMLANKQFAIQSRLIGLDFMYFMQQKYGRFLYYLSPPSWRSRNRDFARSIEIEAKGFDLGTSSEEDTFTEIFEKMQNECFSGLVKPALYFKHPSELMSIFESIAQQQLYYFSHVTNLLPYTKSLKQGINRFQSLVEEETSFVIRQINNLKITLQSLELKDSRLSTKFMKILNGLFYDSVAATDVLKLNLHLEFCYEKLYGEKSPYMSLLSNAKALETMYMEYSYKLDIIHGGQIKLFREKCVAREKNKMKRAEEAAYKLSLFNNLKRSLLRAHAPIAKDKPLTLIVQKKLSKIGAKSKIVRKSVEISSDRLSLTESEIEYLTFPANYLSRLTYDKDSMK